jgi:translocation and assembly module TamA
MKAGAGLGYKYSRVKQFGVEDEFSLISLPGRFTWDTSDDLLDPTRGGRLNLRLAPFFDTFKGSLGFVKGYGSYSRYLKISKKPFLVLAGRAALGSIWGEERDSIPADERWYAGGGGSVRGFAYQFAGPLFDGDPIGGRSLLELSFELRAKVTKKIGIVTFIDGGSAFKAEFPDFKEDLRWGGGVGVRYYTPIGPVRLDVAVPLNPREDIDDPFQIYISIGQAF